MKSCILNIPMPRRKKESKGTVIGSIESGYEFRELTWNRTDKHGHRGIHYNGNYYIYLTQIKKYLLGVEEMYFAKKNRSKKPHGLFDNEAFGLPNVQI